MPQAWKQGSTELTELAVYSRWFEEGTQPFPVAAPVISTGFSVCLPSGGVQWERCPEGDELECHVMMNTLFILRNNIIEFSISISHNWLLTGLLCNYCRRQIKGLLCDSEFLSFATQNMACK